MHWFDVCVILCSTSVSVTEMSAAGVELVVDDYDATDGSYPPSMHAHSS